VTGHTRRPRRLARTVS